ncbi:MAG: sigma D regulator [Gammaproteobacteria bacterium]|nr:sigma D regulator [Gammaproteobacteria bacterium]
MGNSQLDTIAEIAQKVSAENDRRQRQTHSINELLNERQEVLVAMCQLADFNGDATTDTIVGDLKSFNQTLVDYTALGHFELYERIIEGKERRVSVSQVANQVYPTISATTEKIVEFNDKYDGVDDGESLQGLQVDLSAISEVMAQRIESEDQLLQEMNGRVFSSTN